MHDVQSSNRNATSLTGRYAAVRLNRRTFPVCVFGLRRRLRPPKSAPRPPSTRKQQSLHPKMDATSSRSKWND